MALQLNLTLPLLGLTLPAAYVRVQKFVGTKKGINAIMEVFADNAARQADKTPITTFMYQCPAVAAMPNGVLNYIYTQLKATPSFVASQDV